MIVRREIVLVIGVIAISLGLNALLVARLVGSRSGRNFTPQERFEAQLDAIWRALPEPDQVTAREIVARQHDDLSAKWRAMLSNGRRARVALRASSFDEGAAKSAFGQLNQASSDYQLSLESMKLEIAGKVSDEGRLQLSPWGPSPRKHR